jgi:hypothetical protein
MGEKPAPTPQALREQARHATRLADGIIDERARAALLGYAEELIEKAAQLEAGIAPC